MKCFRNCLTPHNPALITRKLDSNNKSSIILLRKAFQVCISFFYVVVNEVIRRVFEPDFPDSIHVGDTALLTKHFSTITDHGVLSQANLILVMEPYIRI